MHIAGLSRRMRRQSNLKEYFLEPEREVDKTSEEGHSLQVIYCTCTMKNNLQTRMR